MKISPTIYAKVFAEVTKGKSPKEIEAIIGKLSALIAKNGDITAKEKILALAEKYVRQSEGKHSLVVETARNLPESFYADVLKKMGSGEYDLQKVVDEDLVAGAKLTVDESRELDVSLKGILKNIFDKK